MYFVRTALFGMARALSFTCTSTLTLAAALWIMAVFGMALVGARTCVQAWGRGGHVSLGVALDVPRAQWPAVLRAVQAQPGVAKAALVPPEEALADYRRREPQGASLTEGIDPAMLPAAITAWPEQSLLDAQAMAPLAATLAALPGIDGVDYGQVPLARLRAAVRWGAAAVVGLLLALGFAMTFMVMNTVRLVVVGRQEEIRILRLVGATAWFVRLPFLLEGALTGALAGAVGAVALALANRALAEPLGALAQHLGTPPLGLFCWPAVTAQLGCGTCIGLVASYVAVSPFLRQDVG